MKNGLIYKITNKTSKKSYIGKSMEYRFEYRIEQHKNDNSDTHFARAKRKYGWDDFIIEIIEENIPKHKMSDREKYWISYFDTFNNGYNSTVGGEGGNTYAKKTKDEMKIIKEKISKANKGSNNGNKGQYVGEKNGMYGKKHSSESKAKLSKALLGVKKPQGHGSNVSKALKGKPKHYINYSKFIYIKKDNIIEKMKANEVKNKFNIKDYVELKKIIDNKIKIDGYEIIESVETTENIL